MSVELREVTNLKGLRRFILFPFSLYKNNKYWVPPLIRDELTVLRSDKNPAFDHCDTRFMMAYKDGKPAGRIVGIINHLYNQHAGVISARFGWLDFIDDKEVSKALIKDIEDWALSKGMTEISGPMGFTTFDRQGILIEGFDELPTISATYNFSYYGEHLDELGYSKKSDYIEYEIKTPPEAPPRPKRMTEIIEKRYGLKILQAKSRKELIKYADQVLDVINAAYEPILGFVRLTDKQIDFFIKKYFSVILPEYTIAVMDKNDKMAGFQIAMPSLSKAFQKARGRLFPFGFYHIMRAIKNPEKIDLLLVGILPEYKNMGVNAFFLNEIANICQRNNIPGGESNGLLEENVKVQAFNRYFDTRQHKRRRLFFKSLEG